MGSSDLILHSGANQITAEKVWDDGARPGEGRGHPVANTTMTSNEKEAQKDRSQHDAPKSGKENDCNRQPEDRQLLELLEFQKRMFQST